MLKLLKLQEKLLADIQEAVRSVNIPELNRLILRSEKLDLNNHPG